MSVPVPALLQQRTRANSFLASVLAEALFCRRHVLNCSSHVGTQLKETWCMMLYGTACLISLGLYWLGKLLIILMSPLACLKFCATVV